MTDKQTDKIQIKEKALSEEKEYIQRENDVGLTVMFLGTKVNRAVERLKDEIDNQGITAFPYKDLMKRLINEIFGDLK